MGSFTLPDKNEIWFGGCGVVDCVKMKAVFLGNISFGKVVSSNRLKSPGIMLSIRENVIAPSFTERMAKVLPSTLIPSRLSGGPVFPFMVK